MTTENVGQAGYARQYEISEISVCAHVCAPGKDRIRVGRDSPVPLDSQARRRVRFRW
jgi:hypothetical protein